MALFWTGTGRNRLQVWGLSVGGSLLLHLSVAFAAVYLAAAVLPLPAEKPVEMDVIILEIPTLEAIKTPSPDAPAADTRPSVGGSSAFPTPPRGAVDPVEPVISVKPVAAPAPREFPKPVEALTREAPVVPQAAAAHAVGTVPVAEAEPLLHRVPVTPPVVHRQLVTRPETVSLQGEEMVPSSSVAPVTRERKAVAEAKHVLADAPLTEGLPEGLMARRARSVPVEPIRSRPMTERLPPQPIPQEVVSPKVAGPAPSPLTRGPVPEARVSRQESGPSEPPQAQDLPVRSGPSAHPDFGWVAQALWQRLAELKRYPHVARVNRWEGTVVVRAVVKPGGDLEDLALERSSGHASLDEDALDLLRQVSPLSLAYELGRAGLQVRVPITYKLE